MTGLWDKPPPEPGQDARRFLLGGLSVIFLLSGVIGVWAARTEIAGAVIAQAIVVVETHVKKVQHPSGGIVGEIRVRNGDKVRAGDVLIRLDDTVARANLQLIANQLDELAGREARLEAERDGGDELRMAPVLAARAHDAQIAEILAGEQSLLRSRNEVRTGEKAQLRQRIAQLHEEIAGTTAQMVAKDREIVLIGEELEGLEKLEAAQLVTTSKMVALRREAARLEGERAQLSSAVAQARGRIAEIELQLLRIDQQRIAEAIEELRDNQARQAELAERRIAAEDQLRRMEIRAPQAGIVHQLSVHTVGGVVAAGEPVMLIVPEEDKLVVEARVAPQDIDQVLQSETALVRFPAFDQRTTPELDGRIAAIAADRSQDSVSGESFYVVRIEIPDRELAQLGEARLVPGMPAEVQIRTQYRTVLSYLVKPFEDQFARAFRER